MYFSILHFNKLDALVQYIFRILSIFFMFFLCAPLKEDVSIFTEYY